MQGETGKGVNESSMNPGREGKGVNESKRFEIKRLVKLHCKRLQDRKTARLA